MASLDAMKLLARGFAFPPDAGNREAPLVMLQLNIVLGQPREFDHHDILIRGFEDVNRWRPTGRSGGESGHPLLNGQQVLERIPAYKGHGWIVPPFTQDPGLGIPDREKTFDASTPEPRVDSRAPSLLHRCATIERFYRRYLWLLYKQRD